MKCLLPDYCACPRCHRAAERKAALDAHIQRVVDAAPPLTAGPDREAARATETGLGAARQPTLSARALRDRLAALNARPWSALDAAERAEQEAIEGVQDQLHSSLPLWLRRGFPDTFVWAGHAEAWAGEPLSGQSFTYRGELYWAVARPPRVKRPKVPPGPPAAPS